MKDPLVYKTTKTHAVHKVANVQQTRMRTHQLFWRWHFRDHVFTRMGLTRPRAGLAATGFDGMAGNAAITGRGRQLAEDAGQFWFEMGYRGSLECWNWC